MQRNTRQLHAFWKRALITVSCCSAIVWAATAAGNEPGPANMPATAGQRVQVVDAEGQPVAAAVLWFGDGYPALESGGERAVINQIEKQFVPEVTVIRTGTHVEFPNQDSVAHHVYSFAQPNSFEFPLYKSDERPSVRFTHAGVVALGCNIHDSMLGYVVVVDSPYYALTDADGYAHFAVPPPVDARIHIWSARLDPSKPLAATLSHSSAGTIFAVDRKLRPESRPAGGSLAWEDY